VNEESPTPHVYLHAAMPSRPLETLICTAFPAPFGPRHCYSCSFSHVPQFSFRAYHSLSLCPIMDPRNFAFRLWLMQLHIGFHSHSGQALHIQSKSVAPEGRLASTLCAVSASPGAAGRRPSLRRCGPAGYRRPAHRPCNQLRPTRRLLTDTNASIC
jgi:hypothetical protein